MSKRLTRGWLVRAGIASAMGAAAIIVAVTMGGSGTVVQAAPPDMNQAVAPAAQNQTVLGSSFAVNINVTNINSVTWGGYSMELTYSPSILVLVGVPTPGNVGPGCTGGSWANVVQPPGTILDGCFGQTATGQSPPPSDIIMFQCVGQGTTTLHLKTLAEDPVNGSGFFDAGASPIPTSQTDGTVTCQLPITKSHAGGATLPAGSNVVYTVHVGNPTAFSIPGNVITDNVPAAVTVTGVTSTNGALDSCGFVGNAVSCTTATINSPGGLDVNITASIPLSAAGTGPICNSAQLNPSSGPVSNSDCFNVAPATLVVTKTVIGAGPFKSGDPLSYTITVSSPGGSSATGVVVTDTSLAGFVISGQTNGGTCIGSGTSATIATWNCGTLGSAVTSFTVVGNVSDPNPSPPICTDQVKATSTNGAVSNTATANTACVSKNVRMVKDTDGNLDESSELANLWLCKGITCTANGQGQLTVSEWALNVSGDPQGVGAFEFQVKYDNHIFDILICEGSAPLNSDGTCAASVSNDPLHWLYSTGRVPGAVGIGGCAATIITENDIRFGCVSKTPQPINPANGPCLGQDNVTLIAGEICGPKTDGIAATIHVTPKADLVNRMTPGNNNGAIRTLLDEGCELADIWGHPLSAASGAFDPSTHLPNHGYDALGREIPLPGIAPGGQVTDCADITITVRILEGDMNLDCIVDVSDDQMEASHYGALFGNLLYEPWFDLEPGLKDGDVDIKDLQKVFGRNGSTCVQPLPNQDPLPEPVDP